MYYKEFYRCRTYFNILARHAGTYKMPYNKFKHFIHIDHKYRTYPDINLIDLYNIFDTRTYLDDYHQNGYDINNYKQAVNDLFDIVHDHMNHVDQLNTTNDTDK